MRLRIMKILLFIPCVVLDGCTLCLIGLPLWIVTGKEIITHEPLSQWLFELK
jgi:hypothetical protein